MISHESPVNPGSTGSTPIKISHTVPLVDELRADVSDLGGVVQATHGGDAHHEDLLWCRGVPWRKSNWEYNQLCR